MTVEQVTRDDFARQVGSAVRVHEPDVVLTLCEVTERQVAGEFETFAVRLQGPIDPQLDQRTYRFEHGELGVLELFIVPIEADSVDVRYEAVFNRAHRPESGTQGG
jgi:hypothetical protein